MATTERQKKQPAKRAYNKTVASNAQPSAPVPVQTTPAVSEWAKYFKRLGEQYGNLPVQNVNDAFLRSMPFSAAFTNNPYVQNRRVKNISTLPVDCTKDQIVSMLKTPDDNEKSLRQVSNILEYTAYPMLKIRTTYQDVLSYHNYVYPAYAEKEDTQKKDFLREWRMMCKIGDELQIKRNARQIVGQCVRDGKVFYYPRLDVDKAHNQVRRATMQQLPQDWTKIVGFNSISKYTVAFNMFYFLQPGTTPMQFGDLFEPYLGDFDGVLNKPRGTDAPRGVIYNGGKPSIDPKKMLELQARRNDKGVAGNPDVYQQNGTWFYWVELPVDKVWTFEIDDVKANVVSPLTGLFLSMDGIAQYEQVQLELVQNPLVSMVLGTMETYNTNSITESDPIKISTTGRALFDNLFYQMLSQNNTGGVGIFAAPYEDMKLVQLNEAPNATKISAAGYEYAMEKSGMSALIPTTSDARAGVAQISLKLESRYPQHIYWQVERMMNRIFENVNPKYEWRFRMFGDLATDDALMKQMVSSMTLGILPDVFIYNAMLGRSVLDDLSMSYAVDSSDILRMRLPLISTFSAKQEKAGLPPQPGQDVGGRPSNEGEATTGGGEADIDDATGANVI